MTALTAARNTQSREVDLQGYPVATNTVIYKGGMVAINTSGYAVPAADTSGLRVVGVAEETVNNNPGANGAATVKVRSDRAFLLNATSITQAMVGAPMYVVDDNVVDDVTVTNFVVAGRLVEYVSATSGWVYIPRGPRQVAKGTIDATYGAPELAVLNDVV